MTTYVTLTCNAVEYNRDHVNLRYHV